MVSDGTQAGWATADITPSLPVHMGGYVARTRPAESIHDPLVALALAIGTPSEPLILVICDVLSVDTDVVEQVHRLVKRDLAGASVWVGATHTHSGPDVEFLADRLVAGATQAALEAAKTMRPVRGGWVSTLVSGIATNRDHPVRDQELPLDLLCLFDANEPPGPLGGRPRAVLGSFPCHATVLDATNLALSADLPGAFRRSLTGALGSDTWVALATGAGGDISTRHTRRRQDFVELERLGGSLAEQALAALDRVEEVRLSQPRSQQRLIELPVRAPRSPEELQALRGPLARQREAALQAGDVGHARTLETALQGVNAGARLTAVAGQQSIEALVAVAWLGEVALMAIPGELYYQLGSQLRQAHQCRALVLAYTNGYIGYIPTQDAYDAIDYEVLMSPLAPGSGEFLRDTALQLLATPDGG